MMSASLLLFVLFAPPAGRAAGSPAGHAYIPIAAIHSLLQRHADRATVRATLTRTGSPIYVEDSTAGAAAENAPSQGLTIGDQHLITSWPEESERGLVLQGASVRFLWPGNQCLRWQLRPTRQHWENSPTHTLKYRAARSEIVYILGKTRGLGPYDAIQSFGSHRSGMRVLDPSSTGAVPDPFHQSRPCTTGSCSSRSGEFSQLFRAILQ